MDFTYNEMFLIVLTSSFIIFSLAIKNESSEKPIKFGRFLADMANEIDKLINKKKDLKNKDEIRKQMTDSLEMHNAIFKSSIENATNYIYHSFYFIFFFSFLGLITTLISEINIFGVYDLLNKYLQMDKTVYINGFILLLMLYFLARSVFLLICYTKIDHIEYVQRLYNNITASIEPKIESLLEPNKNPFKPNGRFKQSLLQLFFNVFMIFKKNFRQFFYQLYYR